MTALMDVNGKGGSFEVENVVRQTEVESHNQKGDLLKELLRVERDKSSYK